MRLKLAYFRKKSTSKKQKKVFKLQECLAKKTIFMILTIKIAERNRKSLDYTLSTMQRNIQ